LQDFKNRKGAVEKVDSVCKNRWVSLIFSQIRKDILTA